MKKLVSLLVAAVFAVSSGAALAMSHAGAKPMDKKDEMKKGDKKSGEKKAKKAAKKDDKKKDEKK
jgi:Ni/Co efflux regulator RcnB